ncbi:MAG: LysR family transcriptional regulator [Candidatus Eremiobacteraeota bacterium]|nr:LysR family transcriptional regulator [Candidatus Eremiobacteraeota bacterium]MCW5872294.1 LysR family transcriptional regulator [Candidatus Eremiobacteraeota bacterium]
MSIEDWQAFVVLAEHLHFARTADLLGLTQPALSKRIQKLEDDLGGQLFERGRQGTRLTSLGEQLLGRAQRCLASFHDLAEHARRLAAGQIGRLRIGFGFHTLELVPRLLMNLRKPGDEIEVELRDMSTKEQLLALGNHQLDIGFLRLPLGPPWATLAVSEDEVVLVSHREHPVSGLPECRDLPFILVSAQRSPTLYEHSLQLCAACGFHPRVVQQVPEIPTALALVRAGMGVALLTGSFVSSHEAGVHVVTLAGLPSRWQVGAAWHPQDRNPVLQRFLKLLEEREQQGRSGPERTPGHG